MPSTLTCCRMVFPPSTSWPLPPAARIVAAFLHRARELLRDQRQFLVILDGVDDTVELDPVLWALRGAVPHRGAGGSVGCLHSSMQSLLWVLTSWDSSTTALSLASILLSVCCSGGMYIARRCSSPFDVHVDCPQRSAYPALHLRPYEAISSFSSLQLASSAFLHRQNGAVHNAPERA